MNPYEEGLSVSENLAARLALAENLPRIIINSQLAFGLQEVSLGGQTHSAQQKSEMDVQA